jgi:ADP-ribose pyrophosphatase YjhB (NUDIX family)
MKQAKIPLISTMAIILEAGKILLIKRGFEPHIDNWCPPGGITDNGESLEESVVREVKEESGLNDIVRTNLGEVLGPITKRFIGVFLCKLDGGVLKPSKPEISDARWIKFSEIRKMKIPHFIQEYLDTLDLQKLEKIITCNN